MLSSVSLKQMIVICGGYLYLRDNKLGTEGSVSATVLI